MIFGIILIIAGALVLLNYFGIITEDIWTVFFGMLLVGVGLAFIFRKKIKRKSLFCSIPTFEREEPKEPPQAKP